MNPQKIVIVGSVAAGTSVAAKARRNTESAQITVYDRGSQISYSGCGLPYFVGGDIEDVEALTPRTPAWFKVRYNVDLLTGYDVVSVDANARTLTVKNLTTSEIIEDTYDELVLATGASPIVPPIDGVDLPGVFTVRTPDDATAINSWIVLHQARTAVVVGAGYIGMEMAEQLTQRGLAVTIVEASDHAMPRMDADMSVRVDAELRRHGVDLRVGTRVTGITGGPSVSGVAISSVGLMHDGVGLPDGGSALRDGGSTLHDDGAGARNQTSHAPADAPTATEILDADIVIVAVGVRPNTALATMAGATLGASGAIAVDPVGRTSVDHIWAVGDVAESFNLITGNPTWIPLGSTANKMGRIAGDAITGGALRHRGILGTAIVRVFDLTVSQTGLTERDAIEAGYDVEVVHNIKPDRAEYLGGKSMIIKAVADRSTGRLLGAQAIGPAGVDKRIDVLATAISFGADVADLFHLDLAYSPTYSTTKDPVHYTGMALEGAIRGHAPLMTPGELRRRRTAGENVQVVDVRSAKDREKSLVEGSIHIPLSQLRERSGELDPNATTVVYCNKGVTGNAGQNVLRNLGFDHVYNLSGGNQNWQATA